MTLLKPPIPSGTVRSRGLWIQRSSTLNLYWCSPSCKEEEKQILSHKTFFVELLQLSHLQIYYDAPVAGGGPLGGGGHGDEPPPVEGPAYADLRGVAAVAAAGGGARPEELEDGRHGAAAGGRGSLEEDTLELIF